MHASSSSAPSEEPQIAAPPLDPNTAPATNYHKTIPELEVEPYQTSPYTYRARLHQPIQLIYM
jgi:hypothetical protein